MKNGLMILCLVGCLLGAACSSPAPALSSDQEKQATTLDDLAKKSGGDWTKLSAAEQKSAVMIAGSEQGAKMVLMSKSGRLGHGPGTPGGPGK